MNKKSLNLIAGFLIISLSAFFASIVVRSQLGGYDLSPLIDLQWRLSNGELPQEDFINTLPYALILLVKAVSWGELSWHDLTYINIIAAFCIWVLIAICGRNQSYTSWYWLTAFTVSLPLIYTNHLWHSSITQYLAMYFFMACYVTLDKNRLSFIDYLMVFFAAGLLITGKQNIAAPLILSSIVFFALPSQNRKVMLAIILGSVSGLIISSLILHQPLDSFIYLYTAVLGRVKTEIAMYYAFAAVRTQWIAFPLMLYVSYIFYCSSRRLKFSYRLFFYMSACISLIPILTDWDTKWNNLSLPIFIALTAYEKRSSNLNKNDAQLALMISVLALYLTAGMGGFMRERMKHVGPFYQVPAEIELREGYFEGLNVGANLATLIQELHNIKSDWPNANIYFGPRIEFAYLETKTRSPSGFPLWFHPGTSFATQDLYLVLQKFKSADFDLLVFAKNDRTRLPNEILEFVELFYILDDRYNSVDVFIRR